MAFYDITDFYKYDDQLKTDYDQYNRIEKQIFKEGVIQGFINSDFDNLKHFKNFIKSITLDEAVSKRKYFDIFNKGIDRGERIKKLKSKYMQSKEKELDDKLKNKHQVELEKQMCDELDQKFDESTGTCKIMRHGGMRHLFQKVNRRTF